MKLCLGTAFLAMLATAVFHSPAASARDLRILDFGLGTGNRIPCQLLPRKNGLYACFDPGITTNFQTDSTGTRIVQIIRSQVLTFDDPAPRAVLDRAIEFYGTPESFDEETLTAIFGDAFEPTGDDEEGPSGRGLAITVSGCDDQPIACRRSAGATAVVLYNLLDRSERDAIRSRHEQTVREERDTERQDRLGGMKF